MAWIESHQKLEKSGKLFKLASILQINRYQAIGHLHALWWWALDNAEDGDVTRFDSVTLSQVCGWSDYLRDEIDSSRMNELHNVLTIEDLLPALIKAGFIDEEDNKRIIHNWDEYTHRYFENQTRSSIRKEQTRERVRLFRERNANVTMQNGVTETHQNVTVTRSPNHTKPNHTKPKDKDIAPQDGAFEQFWQAYPKKRSRGQALKAWRNLKPSMEQVSRILAAINRAKRSTAWAKDDGQFIPYPATWINAQGWEDDMTEAGNGNNGPSSLHDRLLEREPHPNGKRNLENVPSVQGGLVFPEGLPVLK